VIELLEWIQSPLRERRREALGTRVSLTGIYPTRADAGHGDLIASTG